MKKKIWIFLLIMAIGFFILGTDKIDAGSMDKNKWKIDGIYQLKVNNTYFENYFIFWPDGKFLFINAYEGIIKSGTYQPSEKERPYLRVLFLKDAEIGFVIKFSNFTLPPQIELENKGKTFYFLKKNISFEELMYEVAN